MRTILAAALAVHFAFPAAADEVTGTILAFDRVSLILVLEDNTVWNLKADLALPENLISGDVIKIAFQSAGDSGVGSIQSLERIEAAKQ